MDEKEILGKFLPTVIVEWFDIVCIDDDEQAERMDIYLDEKKVIPEELTGRQLVSDSFTQASIIQDFPMRGIGVYLHVRRRKWKDKASGRIHSCKFDLRYEGKELTKKFVVF